MKTHQFYTLLLLLFYLFIDSKGFLKASISLVFAIIFGYFIAWLDNKYGEALK